MSKLILGAPKSIWDPNSEFQKQMAIYKLKSETKPRKVDMMQSQVASRVDLVDEKRDVKFFTGWK